MIPSINKQNLTLPVQEELRLSLRSACASDIENLRQWKNEQRQYFFHIDEIAPEQQRKWYEAFKDRVDDYVFLTVLDGEAFGCMGIRWVEGAWDVYNVILGRSEFGGMGYISKAFKVMLAFAYSQKKSLITLKVLKKNPAVKWYLKNGFVIDVEQKDYYQMLYQFQDINKGEK